MTKILFRDLPDAGLWRRLAAGFYDALLLLAIWFVLGFLLAIVEAALHGPPDPNAPIAPLLPEPWGSLVILPFLWLVATCFYGWFWLHGGETLGMKTWRLRLVTLDERALRPRDVLLRSAVGTLSLLVVFAGFFWVLLRGRTWHDLASRTRVVVIPREA